MSNKYAVAVTMTEDKSFGTLGILTYLLVTNAASEDEARGKASRQASEKNPSYSIFTTLVATIVDDADDKAQEPE